jgi:Protein of unknown function (DUF2818)
MSSVTAAVWGVLLVALLAANWPFFSERILLLGPHRAPKALGWRALELLLLWAITLGLGTLLEARLGQRHAQGWEFYAAFGFLFVTFAFPGFVWRYLRKSRDGRTTE